MDTSRVFEGTEGGNSSESGWTKYIASTFHENNCEDNDDCGSTAKKFSMEAYCDDADGDERSDDSMASDASSGPSHQGPLHEGRRRGGKNLKLAKDKEQRRSSSGKKQQKQVDIRLYNRQINADEKEKPRHKASTAFSYTLSRAKGSRTSK